MRQTLPAHAHMRWPSHACRHAALHASPNHAIADMGHDAHALPSMFVFRAAAFSCTLAAPSANAVQANPQDPDNFPFMVLGNKIDVDGGNARVVRSG
jgi:hypothetical protein